MSLPTRYDFTRYLSAKKSVDDRALNKDVWQALKSALPRGAPTSPVHILELGAGIGAMIERLLDWGTFDHVEYTALDEQNEHLQALTERLSIWAAANQARFSPLPSEAFRLELGDRTIQVHPQAVDVFDFASRQSSPRWDLLIAIAFLDLVDISTALPQFFRLLRPDGWFYFTINFDGLTLFEPLIDPPLDEMIQTLYHRTMDERFRQGLPSGDSRAGRHLFENIRRAGGVVLASGASDWVVFPGQHGYPKDEAYFLHFIVHTIEQSLEGHPELDADLLHHWASARHAQIERLELIYIAHQLDFFGRVGKAESPVLTEKR
jgi:SAM-dependent methyltransferase